MMSTRSNRTRAQWSAICPDCQTNIRFQEKPELYSITDCPECDAHLEVVSLAPLTLYWADVAEEVYETEFAAGEDDEYGDYDDYDDDDYDDFSSGSWSRGQVSGLDRNEPD